MYENAYGEGVRLAAENKTLNKLLNPATSEGDFVYELFTTAQYREYLQTLAKQVRRLH